MLVNESVRKKGMQYRVWYTLTELDWAGRRRKRVPGMAMGKV
jgi:hypothetical protein